MSPLPVATTTETEMAVIPVAAVVATTEATALMTPAEVVAEEPTEAAEIKLLPMFLSVRPLSKPSTSRATAMQLEQTTTMRKRAVNPSQQTLCTHSAHPTTAVPTLIVHTVVVVAATLSEVIVVVLVELTEVEAAAKATTTIVAVVALTTMATTADPTTDGKKHALITMFRRK